MSDDNNGINLTLYEQNIAQAIDRHIEENNIDRESMRVVGMDFGFDDQVVTTTYTTIYNDKSEQYLRLKEFSERFQEENPDLVKEWFEKHPSLERTPWSWDQYQLHNDYPAEGVFESPATYGVWEPPPPQHMRKGKRRDTKPKAKPRKTVKLGRRDSRRK